MQENAVKKLMVEKICLPLRYEKHAVVAQLVEHWLPKPRVTGSSPAYRSPYFARTDLFDVERVRFLFFVKLRQLLSSSILNLQPLHMPVAAGSQ